MVTRVMGADLAWCIEAREGRQIRGRHETRCMGIRQFPNGTRPGDRGTIIQIAAGTGTEPELTRLIFRAQGYRILSVGYQVEGLRPIVYPLIPHFHQGFASSALTHTPPFAKRMR